MRKSGENVDENSRRVHKQMTQNKTPSHMSSKKRCRPSEEVNEQYVHVASMSQVICIFLINGGFDPTVDS
jgi:hypothetical protein